MTIPRTGTRVVDMTQTVKDTPVFLESTCEQVLRSEEHGSKEDLMSKDDALAEGRRSSLVGLTKTNEGKPVQQVSMASIDVGSRDHQYSHSTISTTTGTTNAAGRRAVSTSILSSDYCKGVAATMKMVASAGTDNADIIALAKTSLEGLSNAYIAGLRSVSGTVGLSVPSLKSSTSGFGPPSVCPGAADKDMIRMSLSKGEYPDGYCYARLLTAEFKVSTSMYIGSWASVMVLLSRSADEFLPVQYLAGYCIKGSGKKRHVLPVSMDKKLERQSVSVVQFLRNAALSSGWAPGTLGSRLVKTTPLTRSTLQAGSRCDMLEVKLGGGRYLPSYMNLEFISSTDQVLRSTSPFRKYLEDKLETAKVIHRQRVFVEAPSGTNSALVLGTSRVEMGRCIEPGVLYVTRDEGTLNVSVCAKEVVLCADDILSVEGQEVGDDIDLLYVRSHRGVISFKAVLGHVGDVKPVPVWFVDRVVDPCSVEGDVLYGSLKLFND